jgi:hypothetical protein
VELEVVVEELVLDCDWEVTRRVQRSIGVNFGLAVGIELSYLEKVSSSKRKVDCGMFRIREESTYNMRTVGCRCNS